MESAKMALSPKWKPTMNVFRPAVYAVVLAGLAAAPAHAAEQAVIPPKPVVLDTPPPPQKATQSGMGNYRTGGLGEAKPAAKAATNAKKISGRKPNKNLKKKKRNRR
jgi:hypothetical protein